MKAKELKILGIYIHIPFCDSKCHYCDFLSFKASEDIKHRYIQALLSEIDSYANKAKGYLVRSIYIGGGTPSSINGFYIRDIINSLKKTFFIQGVNDEEIEYEAIDKKPPEIAEISIEINPGTINKAKLEIYKAIGINRISFGLQSTLDEELELLGRSHSYKDFEENYFLARSLSFDNISIDLISALPKQNYKDWEETLDKVIALKPEHISAYSLIIEEGTLFNTLYGDDNVEGAKLLPGEDLDRLIYQNTKDKLQEAGYNRYEISNYSKPSFESTHNSFYWTGVEYLGMGLGASSYINKTRFSNISDIDSYISGIEKHQDNSKKSFFNKIKTIAKGLVTEDAFGIKGPVEYLNTNRRMEEFMFLGLRMTEGISKIEFQKNFSKDIKQVYGPVLSKLNSLDLLVEEQDKIFLTEYGLDVSNAVFVEFLIED